jgi:hypothetical protein
MDCPVICVCHRTDGFKELLVEHPVGDPAGFKSLRLSRLAATMLMQQLISAQKDGGWARIPVH